MTLRIWHQSFTVLAELGAYDAALRRHFRAVARPDTTIGLHGVRPGTYRSAYPGHDIKHAALQRLHALQFVAAAIRAEREGYDAFALSTLPEPALADIRSLVDIPVVGYGEAAMLAACGMGRRFGALVFIDELAELVEDNARRLGLSERCVGARPVGFRFDDVLAGFADPAPLIERFCAAARRLVAEGADVVIPGEAPLAVLLAANGVTEIDGAAVVDPLAAWIGEAERLVDLKRAGRAWRSRRGYFAARPDPDRIDEVFAFYGLSGWLTEAER